MSVGRTRWRLADGRLGIAVLLFSVACDRAVVRLSTETAPWSYVEDAWGGIAITGSSIAENQVSLALGLRLAEAKRVDSGVCICGTHARVEAARVLVRLDKCMCGSSTDAAYVARFPKPGPGEYEVVYEDSAAGFPHIGRLTVP